MKPDRKWLLLALSLAVVGAFFVLREHWAHVLGFTPYPLLLTCPLLHPSHGHGHRSHTHQHGESVSKDEAR